MAAYADLTRKSAKPKIIRGLESFIVYFREEPFRGVRDYFRVTCDSSASEYPHKYPHSILHFEGFNPRIPPSVEN